MKRPEARVAEAERLKADVQNWLLAKGSGEINREGIYKPEDGSTGTYGIREARDGDQSCWMVTLQEDAEKGRRFNVDVSIATGQGTVFVYVTLETGRTTGGVAPVVVDPRCPRIVRNLLLQSGRWFHGASLLHNLTTVTGFDAGKALVGEIECGQRSVPIIVVSKYGDAAALPDLDSRLAYDLAGPANVYVLDEVASWALTDLLGLKWACYWGAVRLFWPHFNADQDRFAHPLWTKERLQSRGADLRDTRRPFRKQLRRLIFRAAAFGVTKPHEIDALSEAERLRGLAELRERAESSGDFQEPAENYAKDNDQLRGEPAGLKQRVGELEADLVSLERDKKALLSHLRAKGAKDIPAGADEIVPDSAITKGRTGAPRSGETRFYKKTYDISSRDVMVHYKDCGHNRWEGAHRADKAKKGIAELEGREDWKNIWHCAGCTGGRLEGAVVAAK